jgi:Domain of unknown function (DUF5668)
MNRYILIRRLMGPAVLLLIGVLALLHQADIISSFWHLFWPLLLILVGVLKLAERAVLSSEPYPEVPYAGYQAYPGAYPGAYSGAPVQPPAVNETSIVPASQNDVDRNGGGL